MPKDRCLNPLAQGLYYESLFEAEIHRRRWIPCRAPAGTRGYDFIVENPVTRRLFRVQVKGTACNAARKHLKWKPQFRIELRNNRRKRWGVSDCDVFAAFVEPLNEWWLLPEKEVPRAFSMWLNAKGKMSVWRNRWDLFEQPKISC